MGGVFTYGTSFTDTFAGVPTAIDKILKGAKPADMPFQVITRREFVINLKAARSLGLTVPAELVKRTDRVTVQVPVCPFLALFLPRPLPECPPYPGT